MLGGKDIMTAIFEAGLTLTNLMNELAEFRRTNPVDDLTSELVHNDLGEDMLAPSDLGPFFHPARGGGNDTTRTATSLGLDLLFNNPEQRQIWQSDVDNVTSSRSRRSCGARAGHLHAPNGHRAGHPVGHDFDTGDKVVMFYGAANRDPGCSTTPRPSTCGVIRTRTSDSEARARILPGCPPRPS